MFVYNSTDNYYRCKCDGILGVYANPSRLGCTTSCFVIAADGIVSMRLANIYTTGDACDCLPAYPAFT